MFSRLTSWLSWVQTCPQWGTKIALAHSQNRSGSPLERIMNIELTFDPFLIESPICSSTWSRATACSFLRWWWILVGAYFHEHIISWFVRMTLSHHYSSLKLLFCSTLEARAAFESPCLRAFTALWCLRSWKCLCSLLATLFEVSRSPINKRLLWSGVRSGGGRWDAPCPLWNPALPSCQATTWCLARCLAHIPFPGKGANKTSCRSALPRVFVFHQETPLARKSRSCKILPESTRYIPFNLCCPAWNTEEKGGAGRSVI